MAAISRDSGTQPHSSNMISSASSQVPSVLSARHGSEEGGFIAWQLTRRAGDTPINPIG